MSKSRLLEAIRALNLGATREILEREPGLLDIFDARTGNLLHHACSVNCESRGVSPSSSLRLAEFLLDAGLDANSGVVIEGHRLNAVWFAAARARNVKLVELLVRRGGRPQGLFAAAWNEQIPMLKALVRLGANLEEVVDDETPFLHAWKNRRFKAAGFLLKSGADVDFRDSKKMTALHYGLERSFEPAQLRVLVRHGASPDALDAHGVSAMLKSSRKKDPAYLAALRSGPESSGGNGR